MKFRDLRRQYEYMKEEIDIAILEVLEDSNFISGRQVEELETSLAEYVGQKYCVSCANGTDALLLALMVWGIGSGDAVFVPDFTFFASGEVVSMIGATPVFVDIDKETFNISAEALEEAIIDTMNKSNLRPSVILAVDMFGQPADYPMLRKIAEKYDLKILEDGAQGFGGNIQGMRTRACGYGDISTTSFFPAKPLGAYGDGGAIFTDDDEIAELLCSLRVHGKGRNKYDNIRIGLNSRLDTIQAAILKVKFRVFKEKELWEVNQRAENYTKYLEELNTEKRKHYIKTPVIHPGFYSSWAQYTIQLPSKEVRDDLQRYLKQCEIPSMVYYVKPMHMQKAFIGKHYIAGELTNTVKVCDRALSLPIGPYISDKEQEQVIEQVKSFFDKC